MGARQTNCTSWYGSRPKPSPGLVKELPMPMKTSQIVFTQRVSNVALTVAPKLAQRAEMEPNNLSMRRKDTRMEPKRLL